MTFSLSVVDFRFWSKRLFYCQTLQNGYQRGKIMRFVSVRRTLALCAAAFGITTGFHAGSWNNEACVRLFAADTASNAATVEDAVKVLDLRNLTLPPGAVPSAARSVGSLDYEIEANPKQAFQTQQQQFLKLGWKELPGSMAEATYGSGMFQKLDFVVSVTTSEAGKPGAPPRSRVSLMNFGNVRLTTLPVVKGAKSLFVSEATAMYVCDPAPADTAKATRALLIDAGWEPYGSLDNPPDSVMMTFKRNAVQIQANIGVAPGQGGKTSVMYSALLLSADIPAPATAQELQFVDSQKTLRFTSMDGFGEVASYYQRELGKRGWKSTTEEFVAGTDRFKRPIGMLTFRNSAKDLISLDLESRNERTLAVVKHLTADELAAAAERAKEAERKQLAEKAAGSPKKLMPEAEGPDIDSLIGDAIKRTTPAGKAEKVAIPTPAKAKKVDQTSDNVLQIKLAAGTGKAGAEFIRNQLVEAGWKLGDDAKFDKTSGNFSFSKGTQRVTLTFVDTGFTDVTMMVIGIGTKIEPAGSGKAAGGAANPPKTPTAK
jgi:hypothetical protein